MPEGSRKGKFKAADYEEEKPVMKGDDAVEGAVEKAEEEAEESTEEEE